MVRPKFVSMCTDRWTVGAPTQEEILAHKERVGGRLRPLVLERILHGVRPTKLGPRRPRSAVEAEVKQIAAEMSKCGPRFDFPDRAEWRQIRAILSRCPLVGMGSCQVRRAVFLLSPHQPSVGQIAFALDADWVLKRSWQSRGAIEQQQMHRLCRTPVEEGAFARTTLLPYDHSRARTWYEGSMAVQERLDTSGPYESAGTDRRGRLKTYDLG